jgi:hypothetical protein
MDMTAYPHRVLNIAILLTSIFCLMPSAGSAADPAEMMALLLQIEDRVLPLPVVDGVAKHQDLKDYYWDANTALNQRLQESLTVYRADESRPYHAMTIIAGPAGIGKTFIKNGIYDKSIPTGEILKFDLREKLVSLAADGGSELRPDCCCDDMIFNRLTALTPHGRQAFADWLHQQSVAFLVADSLDEIHPDDYLFVLDELERFALHKSRAFTHVVVLGRPLAFRDYWQDRLTHGLPREVSEFVLSPPHFQTLGDLLVSSWNHDGWKHQIQRTDPSGANQPMSLLDYQGWESQDFSQSGEFANIQLANGHRLDPRGRQELRRLAKSDRIVAAVLQNLAGNGIARDLIQEQVDRELPYDAESFQQEFFARWLERDTETDDRPSRSKPELLDVYLDLLDSVAANYLERGQVDRLGYFAVANQDEVSVTFQGEQVTVPVHRLLNRSGLVNVDPLRPTDQRYRFEPVWIHRLLYQRHLDRQQEQLNQQPNGEQVFESPLAKKATVAK